MDAVWVRLLSLIAVTACISFHTVIAANTPPRWVLSSVKAIQDGIREDTPVGTSIAQLQCIDPDGDPIQYEKTKGNAVSVKTDGTVYLAVELDFEDEDSVGYDLGFSCVDANEIGFPIHNGVTLDVELTINDANDIAPAFNVKGTDGYSFSVSEQAQPGFNLVPQIQINDGDRGPNAQLSKLYIICNSDNATEVAQQPETSIATCTKFKLDSFQVAEGQYVANLTLKGPIDYETRRVYSSKLVAIDNPLDSSKRLSTTINIQINVADAQDVDPLFTNLGASTLVSEDAKKGELINMVIAARDGDLGDKRPVTITMENDPLNAFTIDPPTPSTTETGVYIAQLRVNTPLDRESVIGSYEFVVKVTELDKDTLALTDATATAQYQIQVKDVDDEPPQFEKSTYFVNLTEMEYTNKPIEITGLRMVCNDRDEPQNAQYKVRIVSQSFPDVYSINPGPYTGSAILFLGVDNARYLNYDIPEYRTQIVILEAKSTGTVPLSSSTTVSISLLDLNDNKPKFRQASYEFNVPENTDQLPYTIATIKATDEDSGRNGEITYRLEGGTSNKFEINTLTGELKLVSAVDYETTPLYVFLIFAEDNGQDKQISQVQVTVRVDNINDQKPIFEQSSYQTSVNEDQLQFLTPVDITATDNEEGTGAVTYRIIKGQTADNAFNLNSVSGSLTLNKKLNYGENGRYELEVEASDNGSPSPLTATVKVLVNVIDQNNYPPVLNPKQYTKVLSELAKPGTVVAEIKGTDQDSGNFGKITYRISKGGFDNFRINPTTGVLTVNDPQAFDYDQDKFYSIEITGSDGGAPQLFDTAIVKVDITDANNKAPKFQDSIYIATVDENRPVGFVIETVFATDPDSSKDLFYSIQENTISARNSAGSLLTGTERYDYMEAIGVNGENGDVFIKNKLDKELALEITFMVQVVDKNAETQGQIDTTRVAITVTGEANTDISFDRIEQSFVNEGSRKGYEITTVMARDPSASRVQNYQLNTPSPFFEVVQSTGQIRLKQPIDYETDPHVYRIVVKAIANDGQRSATATVTIKVNDDNDNAPVFERSEYSAVVDEDAPPLTRIANIFATDADTASYGPIEYRIGGGIDSGNFALYRSSRGVDVLLAKNAQLNYNERNYYELDIIAVDNPKRKFSSVQQYSSVKLKIQVIDKNNHKPEFLEDEGVRRMAVAETATAGKSVGTIVATDDDFGMNGEVSFYLRPVDNAYALQLFTIIPEAGIITVAANSLIGQGGKIFRLEVFARDGGIPFLSNTMVVEIEVLSTENNDGNPIWHRPANNYIFYAPEETLNYIVKDSGTSDIFQVDPRTGNGIQFILSNLSSNANSFKVDKQTGVLTVVDSLDRERKESYNLLIYAEDISDPLVIRTGRQIIVQLTDKDDNEPTFVNAKNYEICGEPTERPLSVFFNENIEANKVVYTVTACDPDQDKTIYYYPYNGIPECEQGNRASGLKIEENGNFVTKKYIDYEEHQLFTMCVIAQSTRQVRRKRAVNYDQLPHNVAFINFHIRDQNDNGPKFPKDHITGVMLTIPGDYPVVVLDAVDKDGKGFNIPIYTILDSKFYAEDAVTPTYPGQVFVIKNNELHADPPRGHTLQEFAKGRFELTIQAQDPVNPAFIDTQKVTVYVYIPSQAMRVALNKQPLEGIQDRDNIVRELNQVSNSYTFHYLYVSVHKTKEGYNKKMTDVCFVVVDSSANVILDTFQFINLMGQSRFENILNDPTFDVDKVGKCYPTRSSEDKMKWKDLWWVLVVIAIFVGIFSIFCIVIILAMYRRYRRYMETEKTYLVPQ